jgi:hypothetical protein
LNAGIAVALITVFREVGPMGWFHKPTVLSGLGAAARDESIARYWGLLEEERIVRPDGGRSGWWRLTARGALFVNGEIGLDKYVHIYDGRALRFSGATVGIKQCLGEKFDYAELMYGKGEQ